MSREYDQTAVDDQWGQITRFLDDTSYSQEAALDHAIALMEELEIWISAFKSMMDDA